LVRNPHFRPAASHTVESIEQSPQSPAAAGAQTHVPAGQVPFWGAQTPAQSASAVHGAGSQVPALQRYPMSWHHSLHSWSVEQASVQTCAWMQFFVAGSQESRGGVAQSLSEQQFIPDLYWHWPAMHSWHEESHAGSQVGSTGTSHTLSVALHSVFPSGQPAHDVSSVHSHACSNALHVCPTAHWSSIWQAVMSRHSPPFALSHHCVTGQSLVAWQPPSPPPSAEPSVPPSVAQGAHLYSVRLQQALFLQSASLVHSGLGLHWPLKHTSPFAASQSASILHTLGV
jgi:hypothetical protein